MIASGNRPGRDLWAQWPATNVSKNKYEVALALTCVLLIGLGKYAYPPVKHAPKPA